MNSRVLSGTKDLLGYAIFIVSRGRSQSSSTLTSRPASRSLLMM